MSDAPRELRILPVAAGGRPPYPIELGRGLAARLRGHLDGRAGVAAVVDAGFAAAQGPWLDAALGDRPRLVLPSGETTKSLERFGEVLAFLGAHRVGRDGTVVAVGGGVTGDLAGFAAAAWQRGVDLVQVPTTLLAMVDSSVGGKTGVNVPAGKNLVGAFWQPSLVLADLDLLATLPPREFAAGMAEVLKYGLLGDAALWARIRGARPALHAGHPELPAVVERCCAIKAAIVADDERETRADGGRALLNLGHTFGHALEAVAGYGTYLHGEAVAVGLVLAARLSRALGLVDDAAVEDVRAGVLAAGLPDRLRAPLPAEALVDAAARDKKARAGRIRWIVLERIGAAAVRSDVPRELVRDLWLEAGAR